LGSPVLARIACVFLELARQNLGDADRVGDGIGRPLTIKPRAVSTPSPVIDLMAALKRSLAQEPPVPEREPPQQSRQCARIAADGAIGACPSARSSSGPIFRGSRPIRADFSDFAGF